ncbi:MAG: hypothetical protein J0H64_00365, partial [Actinobacteria bacterium]|nr:hypothetical protein [Actinomycetota bacterium]
LNRLLYATELGRATITAANAAQPDYPVTARALTRNEASCRVLDRLGLAVQWEGPVSDPALLTAGLSLSIYADRPLTPQILAAQLALG